MPSVGEGVCPLASVLLYLCSRSQATPDPQVFSQLSDHGREATSLEESFPPLVPNQLVSSCQGHVPRLNERTGNRGKPSVREYEAETIFHLPVDNIQEDRIRSQKTEWAG